MKLFVLYHGVGFRGGLKLNQFFRLFEKVGIRGFFDYETFHQKGKLFDFVGKKKKRFFDFQLKKSEWEVINNI